jgi:prepilin-type N-terminal cleavage/methylation domain-containing protein
LRVNSAFTLIELLTVIAIIGLIAAIVGPSLKNFRKGDAIQSANSQMLAAVARARQLAISERTTVYMVFVPAVFWTNENFKADFGSLSPAELIAATNLVDKQLTGYTFVSLRSIGDQPGQRTPRYLSAWQTLPDSTFIPLWKFTNALTRITDFVSGQIYNVTGFDVTTNVPFPSELAAFHNPSLAPYSALPFIAFDYLGRLSTDDGRPLGQDVFIPLAHGGVAVARDQNKVPIMNFDAPYSPPAAQESPPGSSTNSYNLVHIDSLTGRARLEHQEIK